jgi:hypothetical protein
MSRDNSQGEIRPKSLTPKALEKRIRRRLAADCLILRRTRIGSIAQAEHGDWIVEEPKTHSIIRRRFTLAELAADLGLLEPGEGVRDA